METHLIDLILFSSVFLILTTFIQRITKRFSFLPYTVALLLVGIAAQSVVAYFHLNVHYEISADMIYYVLLPLLLFESAFHINFHQFKLQFKTITFLATFGLMLSIFTIGYFIASVLGYPLERAILFGAIISATDPIAVIALFKTLGAPKRLGLIADGESMLNDATGVIAFRVISGFVVADSQFHSRAILSSFGNFTYVFLGSIIFGLLVGYIFSKLIEKIENDQVLETTMTVAAALGSFAASEHFFHLSGVIATVITGITIGNLGKTKFSRGVHEFVEEFWEYFAFLSVSLVFFFATFNLDFTIFTRHPLNILVAVIAVLIGRAVSVYATVFLTNHLPIFKDEPNIPLKWQHILNWGGLRGVIPLVLVYSLPDTFQYRDDMLSFTFGAFMFTLVINGLTIRNLLFKLGLHLPGQEEELMAEEMTILQLEEAREALQKLKNQEFDPALLLAVQQEIRDEEKKHKRHLQEISTPEKFELSLRLQTLEIERKVLQDLFHQGIVSENVHFDFETELDLQQDALEYPEVYTGRAFEAGGKIDARRSFRKKITTLRNLGQHFPFMKNVLKTSRESTIRDRVALLKARILTSEMVIEYLVRLKNLLHDTKESLPLLEVLIKEQEGYINSNKEEMKRLSTDHPRILKDYQKRLAYSYIYTKNR